MSTPKAASPEASLPDDPNAFWREAGRELVKGSIASCDEIAKQLVTLVGAVSVAD